MKVSKLGRHHCASVSAMCQVESAAEGEAGERRSVRRAERPGSSASVGRR